MRKESLFRARPAKGEYFDEATKLAEREIVRRLAAYLAWKGVDLNRENGGEVGREGIDTRG